MSGPHTCPRCGQIKMLEFMRVGGKWAWVWYCANCGDAETASLTQEIGRESRG